MNLKSSLVVFLPLVFALGVFASPHVNQAPQPSEILQKAKSAFESAPSVETAGSLAKAFIKEKKIEEGLAYFRGVVGRDHRVAHNKTAASRLKGETALQAVSAFGRGALFAARYQWDDAWGAYDEAARRFKHAGDEAGLAAALLEDGSVRYRQGKFAEAASLYEKSLEIRRKLSDEPGGYHVCSESHD